MSPQKLPKLLFFGAGNIAQSIIKGFIRAQPDAVKQILVTAPTTKNLQIVDKTIGCITSPMGIHMEEKLKEFQPDYVFLCMKPQNLLVSMELKREDLLYNLMRYVPAGCTVLSLIAGIRCQKQVEALDITTSSLVRVMLNTAAEFGTSSVFYYSNEELDSTTHAKLDDMFSMIGQPVIKLGDENLLDVSTGICGSGIALFYEIIQAFSDVGVKNGLTRRDSTMIAAQLSKAAGKIISRKDAHPYQLRDQVASPAGTTIFGLDRWHELSINQRIGQAVQASIDRAQQLSDKANGHGSKQC